MKKRRWPLIVAGLLAVVLAGTYLRAQYFGPMTCPASEVGMAQYAEDLFDREITVLKTAREGRAWAMLYEEGTTRDRYLMTFESRLFGLRLRQMGMNTFSEAGRLYQSGSWQTGGTLLGSKCVVEIYGDNRGGQIESYVLPEAPQAARENLEADYILDLYILDGVASLPKELTQIPST